MKIGHFINVMAMNSEILNKIVLRSGIRRFIKDLKLACAGCVLDKSGIMNAFTSKRQWRLAS